MGSLVRKMLLFAVVFFGVIAGALAQGLSLGSAASFNVLASKRVANNGSTIVQGNVGVGTGAELTGFPTGSIKGQTHINNSVSLTALSDLTSAYTTYWQKPATEVLPGSIGDTYLTAGVYRINGKATITGPIILDANYDPNATFIFQINGNLQVNDNITIALINGAKVNNVIWLIEGTANIGQGAYVKGNLVAKKTITLQNDAAVLGRVMSINESVYLNNSILSLPTDLSISKTKVSASPSQKYAVGDLVTYRILVTNLGPVDDEGVMVRDVLPAGLSYVSSTTSKPGTYYDPSFGLWILDELKVGKTDTLTIVAKATMAGYIVNTATVAGTNVDENLNNNKSDADLCVVLSDAGQIQGPVEVCAGSTNTYNIKQIVGATYTWTVPSGWVITAGNRNSSEITVKIGDVSGTISVTVNNICGASPPSRLTVEVTKEVPPKPGPISGTLELCSGKQTTYSIAPVPGALGYTWVLPVGWTIIEDKGTSITITTDGDATTKQLSVSAYNICGNGEPSILEVTPVLKVPDMPGAISGPSAVCATSPSATYSIKAVSNASSYTWSVPEGWTILSGQGTPTITVKPTAQAGEVIVKALNDCGESEARKIVVSPVENPPLAPGAISGPAVVCASTSGSVYSIAAVPNAKGYTWTVPTGWTIVSGQNTPTITVAAGKTAGKITVVALNDCGSNGSSSIDVSVTDKLPAAPTAIKGTPYGCANLISTYSIDPVVGATEYVWTVPAGWVIQSGQGTTTITVKVSSAPGTISVKAKGSCGDSPETTLNVQPQVTLPTAPAVITGPDEACAAQADLTYSVTPIAGITNYNWTVPTGWTIVSGQGTATIKVKAGSTAGNISVTATNDCGTSSATIKEVKVSTEAPPTPGPISGMSTVCAAQGDVIYSIAAVPGATTYEWSAPGWTIISGQGTATVTLKAGSASTTLTVKAKNACGIGSSSTKVVQVTDQKPAAPTAIKGTPYGCTNLTATYTIDAVAGAESYVWEVPAGWSIISGQGSTTITVKVSSAPGTISVKAKGVCGEGPATTLNVTPQVTLPTAPASITGPDEVCLSQSGLTYSVAAVAGATKYNWTVPTGWTIVSGQGTTTIKVNAGSAAGNIAVTVTNDCGTSPAKTKAVKVSTEAPANPGAISGLATVCTAQGSLVYSIADVAGATSYEWSAPGWTIVSGQGTTKITVAAGSAGTTIKVTAKNACGITSSSTKVVAVTDQKPVAPTAIKGTPYGCANLTATYTIDPVVGANGYTWTVPAGWSIVSGQGSTTITVKVSSAPGTISVKANGSCGDSPETTLNVQPQVTLPTAPAAITGPNEACAAQADLTYSVTPITGITNYTWTVPTGWTIVSGQGTATIKVKAGSTAGNISVTATNDCGTSPAATKAVKVSTEAPQAPGAISGAPTVCGGQASVVYSIADVPGATSYEWSAPGWTIVSGQGTTKITLNAGATGTTISVVAKNACGITSPAKITTVITESAPAQPGPITGTTATCTGKEQTYTIAAVAGATKYNWTVPTGWTIISQNQNTIVVKAGATAGNITVTASNGCGTGPASTLGVKPITGDITGIGSISGPVQLCANATGTYTVAQGTNISAYTWEVPTGWAIVSGQGTTEIKVKAGTASGSVKLVASNDCGNVSVSKAVEINTEVPASPGAITGNASGCSGSTQKYSIAQAVSGVSYTWSVPQGWVIIKGQGTAEIEVRAGDNSGEVKVTATNACGNSSASSTKTITITSSTPVVGQIKGETAICNTFSGITYSITPLADATEYTWTVPAGWSIVSGQGTEKIVVNAGSKGGEIKVAAKNTCGMGTNSTLRVSTPEPLAAPGPISGHMDACSTIPTTQYSIEPVEGATGYAWELPLGWTLVAGQGSTTITVNVTSAPGTLKVKAVNGCTQSAYTDMLVQPVANVPAKPAAISGPNEVCIDRMVTYSVADIEDASSYTWIVPPTWKIEAGQGTSQITVKAGTVNGTIEVMANNGCGSSAKVSIQVSVLDMGIMGEISDLSNPCEGLKYMVDPVPGAVTYNWTLPEGWKIVAGDGTNMIMVIAGGKDGMISVVADNGVCGTSPSSIMSDKSKAETLIEVPNVFSPNGDGVHDTWVIKSLERFPDNDITILNRWGTEIFKAKSYKNNWTGDGLAEGTYYYVARVKLCDGSDRMLKGYVTLIR